MALSVEHLLSGLCQAKQGCVPLLLGPDTVWLDQSVGVGLLPASRLAQKVLPLLHFAL